MLREINRSDVLNSPIDRVYAIRDGRFMTLEEYLRVCITDRFLLDEPEENVQRPAESVQQPAESVQKPKESVQKPAESAREPKKNTRKQEEKAEEKADKEKPKRKPPEQVKQEILKAWQGGDRTITEIMEITGYSYPTVHKYIP